MKAIVYDNTGVLRMIDRPIPTPLRGEVLIRVGVSGVNPADWKNRRRYAAAEPVVPHHDGAGVIEAVGPGVSSERLGQRVWLWETGRQRCGGTAQEFAVVPEANAVALPDDISLEVGASLGIPALTAHRCLTVGEAAPSSLAPGALAGRIVLIAGGAGAVGHAAIQLARWSGATIITTVSTPEKAELAKAAGADHVVNYRHDDAASAIRTIAPQGVHAIIELAPHENAELNSRVLAASGVVAIYAGSAGGPVGIDLGSAMSVNASYNFVTLFFVSDAAKIEAINVVTAALKDHRLPVGLESGLPVHHFDIARVQDAHEAVEGGLVGKALVDIADLS